MSAEPIQPILDPGTIDLTIDQADRLRIATRAYFDLLDTMGLRSTLMIHRLTEGAAVDAFPDGLLWTANRHRTWDWRVGERHTVNLFIPAAEKAA